MGYEELVRLLKKTKKMDNKYLAKRIQTVGEEDTVEKKRIYNKIYQLLLSLLDDSSRKTLLSIDSTVQFLSKKICEESGWKFMDDASFFFIDEDVLESYQVVRTREGYSSYGDIESNRFLERYSNVLQIIHDALCEKNTLLESGYSLKNEKNRDLVEELISYIHDFSYFDEAVYVKK